MLAPPPGELAPPPRGNPGSATDYHFQMDRHWDQNTKMLVQLVQFPLEAANFFAQINLPFTTK